MSFQPGAAGGLDKLPGSPGFQEVVRGFRGLGLGGLGVWV